MAELGPRLAIERARTVTLHLPPARRSSIPTRHGPRAILDDDLRARTHACHQRSKVARRFRLGDVNHVLSHEAIIHRYLLMLWPSACLCSCTWLRADDGSISRTGDTDSRFGSIAD